MVTQLNNPRQIARELLKDSVSNDLWLENQQFVTRCRERLQSHPIAEHSMIQALNRGSFRLDAMQKIHLDYRHAIVQIFTDALLMAQVQSRQLERKLAPGTKMYARFLLTLNTLDEFGFKPGIDQNGYYRGNPCGRVQYGNQPVEWCHFAPAHLVLISCFKVAMLRAFCCQVDCCGVDLVL